MKETYIIEKREATASEKASAIVYEASTGKLISPEYLGQEEAVERLSEGYYPVVRVSYSSYIPVKYRNDSYITVRQ